MTRTKFDKGLARSFAHTSRRGVIAGLLASVGLRTLSAEIAAKKKKKKKGRRCNTGQASRPCRQLQCCPGLDTCEDIYAGDVFLEAVCTGSAPQPMTSPPNQAD